MKKLKLAKYLLSYNKLIPLALFLSFPLAAISAEITNSQRDNSNDHNEELLKQISRGFSKVAKKAIPAVVYIESEGVTSKQQSIPQKKQKRTPHENPFDYFNDDFFNRFFGLQNEEERQPKKRQETVRGSGFIVTPEGHILTNNHVVEGASKITVTLHGGYKVTATIIGTDPKTDLAVIKISQDSLPYLTFGNSDELDVGDWVIAVGNPFGLDASVTVGVVSAKGRNQLHITDFEDFIQTDAAINPGNSGGPLLNIDGEVIGINTAIVSGSGGYMGIGFAIPSNMAIHIMNQLIKTGSVIRGFLGVTLQPIDDELAKYYKLNKTEGALVTDIVKDSPAEKAGLQQEDVIVKYNGANVDSLSSFRNAVSLMAAGEVLNLEVLRDGKTMRISVTIGNASESPAITISQNNLKIGIEVQNLTPEISQKLGYTEQRGVVVTSVKPGSAAAEAGIRPGALILAVNRNKVATVEEFQKELQEAVKSKRVLLMIRQGDAIRFLAFPIE